MADLKRPKGDDYIPFFKSLLMDVEALTGLDLALDAREIERRAFNEGLSFLTKTLPAYYKHVLRCVELGSFTPVLGFKHTRKGPLPYFLGGLVKGLFADDGSLRMVRESPYLGYIGQICTFMYKCEFPYTQEQEAQRLRKFKEVEDELPTTLGRFSDCTETILRNAIDICRVLFRDFSLTESPRNGPGAVAERLKAGEKYDFHFSDRTEDVFPFDDWFATYKCVDGPHQQDSPYFTGIFTGETLRQLSRGSDKGPDPIFWDNDHVPARGLFVNKDSRGPRYISAEPVQNMFLQQSVGRSIMQHLDQHHLTRGQFNFHDQTVNGQLALHSSVSGFNATVDLEDASDRVSLAVVRLLLPSNLVRLLEACRSNSAVLPDGTELELKKFAPMGSACCFPVESVVFFALSAACVWYHRPDWSMERVCRAVHVYGDDIIIPVFACDTLYETFPDLNLKVNEVKSYSQGPFRESCGVDAIDGYDISSVKLRRPVPTSKDDVSTLISWCETSNLLFYAGFWRTADLLASRLRSFRPLPYVPYQSGLYGITGFSSLLQTEGRVIKWNKRYQRPCVKMTRVKALSHNWSKTQSVPVAAPLHTLIKGYSQWEVNGRAEASTLIGGQHSMLSLHHQNILL